MPRLMSVAFTEDAVRDRSKTVTRRKGWANLTPGTPLTLCRKVMGRRKGEPLVRVAEVEVVSVRRERLRLLVPALGNNLYGPAEMVREGFPGMDPVEFIRTYFVEAQRMHVDDEVTRIEWRYLDAPTDPRTTAEVIALDWFAERVGTMGPKTNLRLVRDLINRLSDAGLLSLSGDTTDAVDPDVLEVLEYVSRGRNYVDVTPYPDFNARRALGRMHDEGSLRSGASGSPAEAIAEALREYRLTIGPNTRDSIANGMTRVHLSGGERHDIGLIAARALGLEVP